MAEQQLRNTVLAALEDHKALDILELDVRNLTGITDWMIIASGRSDRQVRALADKVIENARQAGVTPLGVEGQQQGEWILIDLCDVIVHVMHPTTRAYYQLEKLWSTENRQTRSST